MKSFKRKFSLIWHIISGRLDHFFIVSFNEEELINLLKDEDSSPEVMYMGLKPYLINKLILNWASNIDNVEMITDRAIFEAEAHLFFKNKTYGK